MDLAYGSVTCLLVSQLLVRVTRKSLYRIQCTSLMPTVRCDWYHPFEWFICDAQSYLIEFWVTPPCAFTKCVRLWALHRRTALSALWELAQTNSSVCALRAAQTDSQYGLDDEFVRVMCSYLLRIYALFIKVKRMNPFYINSELFF